MIDLSSMIDTSEQNIKMCAKAVEVQRQHKPIEGDWLVNTSAVGGNFIFVNYREQKRCNDPTWSLIVEDYSPDWLIWLPTQGQLQRMIDYDTLQRWGRGGKYLITTLIEKFSKFVSGPHFPHFNSLEQLWLAFVYKEMYSKVWVRNEWATTQTLTV